MAPPCAMTAKWHPIEMQRPELRTDAILEPRHLIACVFHFVEFGELKYVHVLIHHTTDSYSGFQWASALSFEKAETPHFLKMMAILEILLQTEADDALTWVSIKI